MKSNRDVVAEDGEGDEDALCLWLSALIHPERFDQRWTVGLWCSGQLASLCIALFFEVDVSSSYELSTKCVGRVPLSTWQAKLDTLLRYSVASLNLANILTLLFTFKLHLRHSGHYCAAAALAALFLSISAMGLHFYNLFFAVPNTLETSFFAIGCAFYNLVCWLTKDVVSWQ